MPPPSEILAELARVKALFQLRAITAVIGIPHSAPTELPGAADPRRDVPLTFAPAGFSHTLQHSRQDGGDRLGVDPVFHSQPNSAEASQHPDA